MAFLTSLDLEFGKREKFQKGSFHKSINERVIEICIIGNSDFSLHYTLQIQIFLFCKFSTVSILLIIYIYIEEYKSTMLHIKIYY